MANTIQTIEKMQASFPHIYNVYDKSTILYALLSAFGEKYSMRTDTIDRLYAMIGIDSTYDEDLEHRWGSLLNIYKQSGESYDEYRSRLKIVYSSLNGGTAEAIKYAIASASGINSDIDKYVHIYDAWKYPYEISAELLGIDEIVDETSLYGSIICTVDLAGINNVVDHTKIANAINQTKASGINPCLLFLYNIEEYVSLSRNCDVSHDIIKQDMYEVAGINNVDGSVMGEAIFGKAIFGDITNTMDSFTDNVAERTQESGKIDIVTDNIDKIIPQMVRESVSVSGSTDNLSKITQETQELVSIGSVINDNSHEVVIQTVQESGTINNTSNTWGSFGTNSAILNRSFVTNIYAEPDEHVDIIIYSAEFGDAVFGHTILGITI